MIQEQTAAGFRIEVYPSCRLVGQMFGMDFVQLDGLNVELADDGTTVEARLSAF